MHVHQKIAQLGRVIAPGFCFLQGGREMCIRDRAMPESTATQIGERSGCAKRRARPGSVSTIARM